jgi:hypothetical protein
MANNLKVYTVVCGGHPLVTLKVEAVNAGEALLYADALLKDGVNCRVEAFREPAGYECVCSHGPHLLHCVNFNARKVEEGER